MRLIKLESFEQGEVSGKLHPQLLEPFGKLFQVLPGVQNSVSKPNQPQENQHFAGRNYDTGRNQSKLTVRKEPNFLPIPRLPPTR